MTAINQNDSFYAGNKRTLQFTINNKDVDPVAALNLTGMTARWELSRLNSDGDYSTTAVLTKTTSDDITITNAAQGKLSVDLDSLDTAKLSGLYHQELQLIDSGNNSVVVATGTITILKNISNS